MPSLDLSPQAQADIDQIYWYIVETNLEFTIADTFDRNLHERMEMLSHFAMSGVSCADMRKENSRRVIYQSHIIYYRPVCGGNEPTENTRHLRAMGLSGIFQMMPAFAHLRGVFM